MERQTSKAPISPGQCSRSQHQTHEVASATGSWARTNEGLPVGSVGLACVQWVSSMCSIGLYFQHLPTQSAGASDPAAGLWHPGLWRCQSPHGLGLQANSGLLPSLQWLHFWGVWGFTRDGCWTCSTVGPVGRVGQRFDGVKRSVAQANDLCGCWEGLIDSIRWGQNALSIVMKCHE